MTKLSRGREGGVLWHSAYTASWEGAENVGIGTQEDIEHGVIV